MMHTLRNTGTLQSEQSDTPSPLLHGFPLPPSPVDRGRVIAVLLCCWERRQQPLAELI